MTIIEILDGLAELGRLRLEREARERQVDERGPGMSVDMPPQISDDAPVKPEPEDAK